MKTIVAITLICAWSLARAADPVEGTNYFRLDPPQSTSVAAGMIEVTEVFSYGCPACNQFHPLIDQFQAHLPRNVVLDFVPASFSPAEDWPMFQRAYLTAQVLGIDRKTNDAMYDAVWKTGQLATVDYRSGQLRSPAPTIADAATFYASAAGVQPATFLAAASSFGVDVKIRQAEQFVRACAVDSTPTMIINGKYRVTVSSAGGYEQLLQVTKWLVGQESAAAAASGAPGKPRHAHSG